MSGAGGLRDKGARGCQAWRGGHPAGLPLAREHSVDASIRSASREAAAGGERVWRGTFWGTWPPNNKATAIEGSSTGAGMGRNSLSRKYGDDLLKPNKGTELSGFLLELGHIFIEGYHLMCVGL